MPTVPVSSSGTTAQRLDYVISARDQRFQAVADRVIKRLNRLERQGRVTTRAFTSLSTTLRRNLSPALGAVAGGAGFGLLLRRITQTGLAMQALNQRFQFATGTFTQGRKELEFVGQLSERLGLDFFEMSRGLANLSAAARGTALEGAGIRQVFQSVAEATRVLHLDLGQTRGTFRALEQIMSKGRVQAEELRGQLGERLPGAFQIAARAVGVTSQELSKMLELGQLESVDFLPRFARQLSMELGNSLEPAARSSAAEFARLGNAVRELEIAIAESGFLDFLTEAARLATDLTRAMSRPGEILESWVMSVRDLTVAGDRLANTLRASIGLGPLPDLAGAARLRSIEDAQRRTYGDRSGLAEPIETRPILTSQPRLVVPPRAAAATAAADTGRRPGTSPADLRRQAMSARFAQILVDREETRQRLLRQSQSIEDQLTDIRNAGYQRERDRLMELAELRERATEQQMELERRRYADARSNLQSVVGAFIRASHNLGDALFGVLDSISNAIINQFAGQIAGSLLAGAGGGFLTSAFGGSLFGAQRGGPVQRGRAVLVGEGGPEVFVPRTSGRIVPNQALGGTGGSTVNLTFNIESTDGPGVRAAIREAEPRLTSAALSAVAVQQARPGSPLGRQNRQAP